MTNTLMTKEDTALVVIDLQTGLLAAMSVPEETIDAAARLIKGARALSVPVLATQQYTKGLGESTDEIKDALGDFKHVEKKVFSAMRVPEFAEEIRALGVKNIVMAGIEMHVCVQQTALELMNSGYNVYIAADCTSSRTKYDKENALRRLTHAGAVVTTYESVLFELLGSASAEGFKEISNIVK